MVSGTIRCFLLRLDQGRRRRTRFVATCLCMALLALTQLSHATAPPQDDKAAFQSQADTYAHAAGLPTLDTRSGFELRVWGYDYMGRNVSGGIVSKGQLRLFISTATYKRTIKPARLSSPIPVSDTQKLKALLAKLEPLNGTMVSCPALDGGSVLIDAVLDGRIIRISAENPWACADKDAQAVMQLLYELGDDEAILCLTREELIHGTPWVTGFWRGTGELDDDGESEILVFHQDGTLLLYDSDYSPFLHLPLSHYKVAGDDIRINALHPLETPTRVTLHANRDRTRLVLSIPGKEERVTYVRLAGKACITQQDLKAGPEK